MHQSVAIATASGEETEALAGRLARAVPSLAAGAAIVWLAGELGSGKTTFARGALRALGVRGTVRSPTYTLLERYETGRLIAVHLDLYRLHEAAELEQLGLRELHRPWHLWLIEWPERGAGRVPQPDVRVSLEAGASTHRLTLAACSDLGTQWLESAQLAP